MPKLLDELAELEHEQWAHWTQYMLDNMTPENTARWRKQIATPYSALSEEEKESDREWARKVGDVLMKHVLVYATYWMLRSCSICQSRNELSGT